MSHLKIGIMQNRLSPRFEGRFQGFHPDCWPSEFHIAKDLGFDRIEFILDHGKTFDFNPLMTESGTHRISEISNLTGVEVKTICADYFMEAPLHRNETHGSSLAVLNNLITSAAALGITDIIVPCVDQSSLNSVEDKLKLRTSIDSVTNQLKEKDIRLNLETDLDPKGFKELLEDLDPEAVWVNYDIGNSASLEFDPEKELSAYGERISDLHVKDRSAGGPSIELGKGNAKFDVVFSGLSQYGFKGPVTMQAFRSDNFIDDLNLAKKQLEFTKNLIAKHLGEGIH